MSGIPTLDPYSTDHYTLRAHWMFLRVRVESEPLAAALVGPLAAFGPQWEAADVQVRKVQDALLGAKAGAVAADNVLNRLADQVSAGIHDGKKPDLSLPLHQLYFGSLRPSLAKRPILGAQLDRMLAWPALLAKATQPALLALAPAVADGVKAASAAESKLIGAQADMDKMKLDGELKKLFEGYNALAATTFGELKAIVHDQPELKLERGWAESFFLHEARDPGPSTVAQAQAAVARAEEELAAAQERLEELEAKKQAAEAAAVAAANAMAAVAAAKKDTAAAKLKEKEAIAAAKKAKQLQA